MRSRTMILVCSILMLAACRGERPANEEAAIFDPAASITTTMPEPVTPPDTAAGMTVLVTINDGHIATQETAIPPGPAVLTVMNGGEQVHNLFVEGPGVKAALDDPLDAEESGTLNVTFQQGTYEFYCPILDHRKNGETLTVPIRIEP